MKDIKKYKQQCLAREKKIMKKIKKRYWNIRGILPIEKTTNK